MWSIAERATGSCPPTIIPSPVSFLANRTRCRRRVEFLEQMTAHCLLRGNAYAEIVRDNRGAPAELIPLHPGTVSVLRIPNTRRDCL